MRKFLEFFFILSLKNFASFDKEAQWYNSNLIPIESKYFEFRDFDFAIGFVFKNSIERV